MNAHRSILAVSLLSTMLVALPMTGNGAVDPYPTGCVSCHVVDKTKGTDNRLSVALQEWTAGKVEPGLLAKSKASAPVGLATTTVLATNGPLHAPIAAALRG